MNNTLIPEDMIDYPLLIDDAMRGVVRSAMEHASMHGLPGEHHFFVSFQTQHPGVSMSPMLRSRYPEEITIVIQHQYWDFKVTDDHFEISLSFNNVPEHLVVPFDALSAFADPSIKFGLQFHGRDWEDDDESVHCPATGRTGREAPPEASFDEDPPSDATPPANDEKVVSIEAFRNNT